LQRLQSAKNNNINNNNDLKKQNSEKSENSEKSNHTPNSSKDVINPLEKRKSDKLIANVLKEQAKNNKNSNNNNELKGKDNLKSNANIISNANANANNSISSTDIPEENVSQKKKDLKDINDYFSKNKKENSK